MEANCAGKSHLRETEWLSTSCDAGFGNFPAAGWTMLLLCCCTSWDKLPAMISTVLTNRKSPPEYRSSSISPYLRQHANSTNHRPIEIRVHTPHSLAGKVWGTTMADESRSGAWAQGQDRLNGCEAQIVKISIRSAKKASSPANKQKPVWIEVEISAEISSKLLPSVEGEGGFRAASGRWRGGDRDGGARSSQRAHSKARQEAAGPPIVRTPKHLIWHVFCRRGDRRGRFLQVCLPPGSVVGTAGNSFKSAGEHRKKLENRLAVYMTVVARKAFEFQMPFSDNVGATSDLQFLNTLICLSVPRINGDDTPFSV